MSKFRILITVALALAALDIHAHYASSETQRVPIDRILRNLDRRLARNSNSVELLYYAARVHAMAYSTNLKYLDVQTDDNFPRFEHPGADDGLPDRITLRSSDTAQQNANNHLTNAIRYYARAKSLAFKGTNHVAHRWLILPIHLGHAWCLEQAQRTEEATEAFRRALQLAWKREVDRQFSLREQIGWSWDRLRSGQNPFSESQSLGAGVCFSEEIIKHLLRILDPVKDAKEIAQLKEDQAGLAAMSRAITPIIVSLRQDIPLDDLIASAARVRFDLDGSALDRRWSWITPEAAWLVYDHDGSGRITSALQMFGSVTFWVFWRGGYAALSSLDDNADGRLTDSELIGLALWHDQNSNGVSEPGEVRTLRNHGIVSVECTSQSYRGGIVFHPRGVVLDDQSTRATYDVTADMK